LRCAEREAAVDETIIGTRLQDLGDAFASRVPVLVVLCGNQIGRRFLLNEDRLVLGRRAGQADILIEGDPQISGAHACVRRDHGAREYAIEDLQSLNGTLVNGQAVARATLQDGDKIVLGQTILKFTFQDAIEERFLGRVDQLMNWDDLTGLPVLRVFNSHLQQRLREVAAAAGRLCVLMMDMDGLKRINDAHGHRFGSYAIATVGTLIGRAVSAAGEAARFGGDEFVAFAGGLDKEQGLAFADALRQTIGAHEFLLEGVRLAPTISIGVAAFPEDGGTLELLVRNADEALYRAKNQGRNCVSR
jgi:diguanylate cyclase (GGDEF)-like protein